MRVFAEKNVKDSGDYKLIKEPAKLKSTFGERELWWNYCGKSTNEIKLPKTKEQWLQANANFSAMLPYHDNNITVIETTLEEFQQTLYTYFRHN